MYDENFNVENGFNENQNPYIKKLNSLVPLPQTNEAKRKRDALCYLLGELPECVMIQGRCRSVDKITGQQFIEFPMSDDKDGFLYFLRGGIEALLTQTYKTQKDFEKYKEKMRNKPTPIVNEKDNPKLFDAQKELSKAKEKLRKINREVSEKEEALKGLLKSIDMKERRINQIKEETAKYEADRSYLSSTLEELKRVKKDYEEAIEGIEKRYKELESEHESNMQGITAKYETRNKDLEDTYNAWNEMLSDLTKDVPMDDSPESVGSVISNLQQDNEELNNENADLRERLKAMEDILSNYAGLEKDLVPELQQIMFTRKSQGKTIRLSSMEIEDVFRMYLTGYKSEKEVEKSPYAISKELNISRTTVKRLLDKEVIEVVDSKGNAVKQLKYYNTVSSLEKIVKGLNRVSKNGNFSGVKKNKLEDYIRVYSKFLEDAKKERIAVRNIFNEENKSFEEISNTFKEMRISGKKSKVDASEDWPE